MTGGVVVILGAVGRNFAAGMSGGVAYVWDPDRALSALCNKAGIQIEPVDDSALLRRLIEQHHVMTGSRRASELLGRWGQALAEFVLVMPTEYRRALAELAA
jgi:glutamate synthase (NADPH/NADH) large chain